MLTPHTEKQREQEAAGTFDTPGSPGISSFSFTNGSHPVELYINGDKSLRADVLFNHVHVIGFLYIQDGILTKEFFRNEQHTSRLMFVPLLQPVDLAGNLLPFA